MRIEKIGVNTEGNALGYWAQIPDNATGYCNIDFHGVGGSNYGGENTLDQLIIGTPPPYAETPKDLQEGCNANGILLLAPQRFGEWVLADVLLMIDIAIKKYGATKIGISGFSMGGAAVTRAITSIHAGKLHWAVSCNGLNKGTDWNNTKATRVWFFHTKDDDRVPVTFTQQAVASMKAVGATPLVTYDATGKHSYNNFYKNPELYAWMKEGAVIVQPPPALPVTITKVVAHYSNGTTKELT